LTTPYPQAAELAAWGETGALCVETIGKIRRRRLVQGESIGDDLHYELLPHHRYGGLKYGFLGLQAPMTAIVPTEDEAAIHAELARYRARERATVPLSPVQGGSLLERMGHKAPT
jgi:hypothetical protein